MDQKLVLKQMIDFNRTVFNNVFQATVLFQEQIERTAQPVISQSNWLPAEGRKAIENWAAAYKTGRDNFKKYVDDSYNKVEEYFAG